MTIQTRPDSAIKLHGEAFDSFSDRLHVSDFGEESWTFQRFSNLGDIGAASNTDLTTSGVKNNNVEDAQKEKRSIELPVIRIMVATSSDETEDTTQSLSPSNPESSMEESFHSEDSHELAARLESKKYPAKIMTIKGLSELGHGASREPSPHAMTLHSTHGGSKRDGSKTRPSGRALPPLYKSQEASTEKYFQRSELHQMVSLPMTPSLDRSSHHGGSEHGTRTSRSILRNSERFERTPSTQKSVRRSNSRGRKEIVSRLRNRDSTSRTDHDRPAFTSSDRVTRRSARKEQSSAGEEETDRKLRDVPSQRNTSSTPSRSRDRSIDARQRESADPSHPSREQSTDPFRRARDRSMDVRSRTAREGSLDLSRSSRHRERSKDASSRRSQGRTIEPTTPRSKRERSDNRRKSSNRSASISRRPPRAFSTERLSGNLNLSSHSRPHSSLPPATPSGQRAPKNGNYLIQMAEGNSLPRSSSTGAMDQNRTARSRSPGAFRNRRTVGVRHGERATTTSSNDRLQALGRLLGDSSHHRSDEDNETMGNQEKDNGDDETNMLGDLLTTNLSGKELRKVLRDREKAKAEKRSRESEEKCSNAADGYEVEEIVDSKYSQPTVISSVVETHTLQKDATSDLAIKNEEEETVSSPPAWQLREQFKVLRHRNMGNRDAKATLDLPPAYNSIKPPTTSTRSTGQRQYRRASSLGETMPNTRDDKLPCLWDKGLTISPQEVADNRRRNLIVRQSGFTGNQGRDVHPTPAWQLRVQQGRSNETPTRRRTIGGSTGDDTGLPPAFRAISKSPRRRDGPPQRSRTGRNETKCNARLQQSRTGRKT